MKNKNGFTLLELLVVVLIIGILAAVALPQYTKSVHRARFAEADTVVDAIKKNISIYTNAHGWSFPTTMIFTGTDGDIEIPCPGGEWGIDGDCATESFYYQTQCNGSGCIIHIEPRFLGRIDPYFLNEGDGWVFVVARGDDAKDIKEMCQWAQNKGYPVDGLCVDSEDDEEDKSK